jgi:hypothetical protein
MAHAIRHGHNRLSTTAEVAVSGGLCSYRPTSGKLWNPKGRHHDCTTTTTHWQHQYTGHALSSRTGGVLRIQKAAEAPKPSSTVSTAKSQLSSGKPSRGIPGSQAVQASKEVGVYCSTSCLRCCTGELTPTKRVEAQVSTLAALAVLTPLPPTLLPAVYSYHSRCSW